MKHRVILAVVCAVVVWVGAAPVSACIWDRDTLNVERQDFPGTLELITGKFLRHSQAFYQWRVKDRTEALKERPQDVALMDDLAAAYDKLGQHDKAIDLMRRKEEIKPGLYETQANLGTFLIHAGRLQEGLKHIDAAIAINPDAHFGREVIQRELVVYVMAQKARHDGALKMPMGQGATYSRQDFATHMASVHKQDTELGHEERQAAIKGVLGMMRFGHYDSPVLLEALGDLLKRHTVPDIRDSGRLAARAYLMASYNSKDKATAKGYRRLASDALTLYEDLTLTSIEKALRQEMADADAWVLGVHKQEAAWIAKGGDVDAQFEAVYYNDGEALPAPPVKSPSTGCGASCAVTPSRPALPAASMVGLLLLGGVLMRRRSRT